MSPFFELLKKATEKVIKRKGVIGILKLYM